MLSLKNIVVHYGGIQALKGVSLEAREGTITTLIGANGAGKSSTLRAISGMVPLTSGEIWFRDHRIDGFDPEEIVEMGIGHVPEGKKLFLEMSVRDNLLTGAYLRRDQEGIERDLKRVCQYFPVLERAYNRPAAQMSGGEQQMLAIARGLMSSPKMLLLDEPSLGLSPLLTREVGAIIRRIAGEGMTILLIEQNASLALRLSSRCYVMETGKVVLEGKSADLQNNRHVKAAYLGVDPEVEAPAVVMDASDGGTGAAPPSIPEAHRRVYDNEVSAVTRPRKNRIPPQAPPLLDGAWEPKGRSDLRENRWSGGDPDPSSLRPRDFKRPAPRATRRPEPAGVYEPPGAAPETGPVVVKKVFRPRPK